MLFPSKGFVVLYCRGRCGILSVRLSGLCHRAVQVCGRSPLRFAEPLAQAGFASRSLANMSYSLNSYYIKGDTRSSDSIADMTCSTELVGIFLMVASGTVAGLLLRIFL